MTTLLLTLFAFTLIISGLALHRHASKRQKNRALLRRRLMENS